MHSCPSSKLSFSVSRMIGAPREKVFEAWVNADILRLWWLHGQGEGPTVCEIDARVGGSYIIKQLGGCTEAPELGDDYEWVMHGEFIEVVEPVRLVFTWNVNHINEPVVDQRVTVEFNEVEGGTRVTITHEGIHSAGMRDGTKGGWSEFLEIQAKLLER